MAGDIQKVVVSLERRNDETLAFFLETLVIYEVICRIPLRRGGSRCRPLPGHARSLERRTLPSPDARTRPDRLSDLSFRRTPFSGGRGQDPTWE